MSLAMKAARVGRASGYPSRAIVRGDPGLFSTLGKIGKAAIGGAVGFATGGVGGAVAGVRGALTNGGGPKTVSQAVAAPRMSAPALPFTNAGPGVSPPAVGGTMGARFLTGGTAMVPTKAAADKMACKSLACPTGYHPNKADYFLRDGTFVPAGSRCVKNRRRDPLNPKALDRSLSRVAATGRAVKRLGFQPVKARHVAQTGKKPKRKR